MGFTMFIRCGCMAPRIVRIETWDGKSKPPELIRRPLWKGKPYFSTPYFGFSSQDCIAIEKAKVGRYWWGCSHHGNIDNWYYGYRIEALYKEHGEEGDDDCLKLTWWKDSDA